ncbi:drug resistance transporter EmrB/QacA subfamily [Xylariomycetidae sp. FL2044]|nr:drug resistance transporter EmrB/QacA subfamily [Xylariomycetidae sp. FL2044]
MTFASEARSADEVGTPRGNASRIDAGKDRVNAIMVPESAGVAPPIPTMFKEGGENGTENDIRTSPEEAPPPPRQYMTGWRLYTLAFAMSLSMFLSTLETTIVSTSLVSITNALGGFDMRDWVVTAYFITYTGFLTIYASFSDVLGRKLMFLLAVSIFTVFSIVCGSISSMVQLIVFRSLQGMGASGIYSLVTVMQPELVPPARWGNFIAVVSLTYVLSSVLGPVLGGAINDHGSWRWVFLLNAPVGAVATGLIAFIMPAQFPDIGRPASSSSSSSTRPTTFRGKLTRASFARLDIVGAVLLLFGSALVVFAFEEGGSRRSWTSPAILGSIVAGGALFLAFVGWEGFVGRKGSNSWPVFPLRLMKNRFFSALVLVALLTGPPFNTLLINLPQRFQAADGDSASRAGVRLLPMVLSSPVAIGVTGQLATRWKVPPFYILLSAASLQLIGLGLASSVKLASGNTMYGFEVILGFGFGMGLTTLLIYTPLVVDRVNLAVAMGAITQIRTLGGTIGLAISSTVLNNYLSAHLPSILSQQDIKQISESVQYINSLPDSTRDAVRHVFAQGYGEQLRVMMYFSAAGWICSLVLWERRLRTVADVKES